MEFNSLLIEHKEYPLSLLQKEVSRLRNEGRDLIDLSIGDPKDETPIQLKKNLIREVENMTHSQYPVSGGDQEYLEAISSWAKRTYNATLDIKKHILSCNGSKEAIYKIPMLLNWSTGKRIFIPSLSYPVYEESARMFGVPITTLPLKIESHFLPDLDSITESEWKTCGLFWINSPHNPTTAIASKAYFEKLLGLAKTYDFLVCSDECYNDISFDTKPASCLEFDNSEQWIVFRSLSKRSQMTGLRVGAMISKNEHLITLLKKMRSAMGVGTPTFIQKAAITAWNDDESLKKNSETYKKKRDIIASILKEKGFEIFGAEAGFYLWISHPKLPTANALYDYFLEHDIVVVPGTAFGRDGENYARMVYCETIETLEKAKEKISQFRPL